MRTTFPANNKTRGYPVGRARVNILNQPDFATVTPTEYKYKDYTIPVNSKINIRIFQNGEIGSRKKEKVVSLEETYTNLRFVCKYNL